MIYFLVTTSIYNDCPVRREQYLQGIRQLIRVIHLHRISDYKIIVIENNGQRDTFLNELGLEIFYTNNNHTMQTNNKGRKELQDVLDCMNHYRISNEDFVVKFTGRYIVEDDSEFMVELAKNMEYYDCILRYGSYQHPHTTTTPLKIQDCITGLIGMRGKYIKQIDMPSETECVEWKWAKTTFSINDAKICAVKQLGVRMCPGGNYYCYRV